MLLKFVSNYREINAFYTLFTIKVLYNFKKMYKWIVSGIKIALFLLDRNYKTNRIFYLVNPVPGTQDGLRRYPVEKINER